MVVEQVLYCLQYKIYFTPKSKVAGNIRREQLKEQEKAVEANEEKVAQAEKELQDAIAEFNLSKAKPEETKQKIEEQRAKLEGRDTEVKQEGVETGTLEAKEEFTPARVKFLQDGIITKGVT